MLILFQIIDSIIQSHWLEFNSLTPVISLTDLGLTYRLNDLVSLTQVQISSVIRLQRLAIHCNWKLSANPSVL